ncbi:MAG: hypothetical protein Q8L00_05815, partial [Deltaproteobacteria bacterium]|nr:hypothetical protein [Deltaproteobacteria bacterium]
MGHKPNIPYPVKRGLSSHFCYLFPVFCFLLVAVTFPLFTENGKQKTFFYLPTIMGESLDGFCH